MIKTVIIFTFIVGCVYGLFGPKCTVDPVEKRWPHMGHICHKKLIYDHMAIEEAIQADDDLRLFLKDVSRIYSSEYPTANPYGTCYLDGSQGEVECQSICASQFVNVTTVWYEDQKTGVRSMCNVIRPWEQIVSLRECIDSQPRVAGMDNSFQCVPESILRRKIAVYCPDITPQCRRMDIDLPQNCAASKFQCRRKKLSKADRVARLFGRFGSFGLF